MKQDIGERVSSDPRHNRRVRLVQALYSHSYDPTFVHAFNKKVDREVFLRIVQMIPTLNELIRSHAPKYPLEQVAKTDLAILRLALYELTHEKKEPAKVIINEAVELAKELGSDRSYAFVNAVLGAVVGEKIVPSD